MKVYSFDNVLITNAKVPDDFIYKCSTRWTKDKDDMVAVEPAMREFSPAFAYKQYAVPYHPGAIKYFKERNLAPQAIEWRRRRQESDGSIMKFDHEKLWRCSSAFCRRHAGGDGAAAQTYGFATLPPGTLNHTTASAISKVLKEKGGINMLVQPTAGDQVINPMVGRGEVEIGITNIMEAQDAFDGQFKDMRIIAAVHALRTPIFVRKDSGMFKVADLKGKRMTLGYSAMRNIDKTMRAQLATAGLTEADVKPVLVPNVVRSADEFMAGNADMFSFAFGGPKVKEADATVGGIRALELDPAGMPAAQEDHAVGLSHRRGARPDLHRRRQADEGL